MEQKIKLTLKEVMCLSEQEKKELTRKNLERVLDKMLPLSVINPKIKWYFNMQRYEEYNGLEKENLSECKTPSCLLCNSARFFEDEFTDDLFTNNEFDYRLFCRKFFPYLYGDLDCVTLKWAYLFHNYWERTKFIDVYSSLKRIDNLLDNDLECNEFDFETNKIIK